MSAVPRAHGSDDVDKIDISYLERLVRYARRAALSTIGLFLQRMKMYGLRPVARCNLAPDGHCAQHLGAAVPKSLPLIRCRRAY